MGCYGREGDELDDLSDIVRRHILAWLHEDRPRQTITCRRCGTAERIAADGSDMVHGQIRMWRAGWRRDPATGRDYCPPCTPPPG